MNESDPTTTADLNSAEIVIHVRDRRKPKQYIVDNLIMDEYHPLIGPTGYSIYSLLVRMSNERDGEQARASLRMMCNHLNIESRSALGYYITFMEILGILFKDLPEAIIIQNGKPIKKKMGNRTNYYYILDVRPITSERLQEFKSSVQTNEVLNDAYRELFLRNIEEWRPIQSLWRRPGKKIKTVIGQDSLPLNFGDEDGETAPPSPTTLQAADAVSIRILHHLEITKPSLLQDLGHCQPAEILALVFYGHTQSWMEEDRLSGYVIKNLQPDGSPAPPTYQELAAFWLASDSEERQEIAQWYFYGQHHAHDLADEYNISEACVKAALKLVSNDPKKNHLSAWLDI